METFKEQFEQVQSLLSSNKSLAYSTLLHLQQQSGDDPSLVRLLADSSSIIVPYILSDVSNNDEETAAQALKCLGFMIYHPSIVGSIKGDDARAIVDSLIEVITTSKIKSVCNLGVWCISMQQFNSSLLDANFMSLLRAITYALDNPIGSLSITFEAMQAVMKLASTSAQNMRAMSNIWAPPVYRRLLSSDKRERDMSERCLQRVSSVICPPPEILSKALVTDLKKTLLLTMEELLNHGLKIQTLQVWRWFMHLLGPYGMKYKHLVNKLLKIPEQTFMDLDPQIQSASLVAWEGLIDSLICSQLHAPESNAVVKNPTDQTVFKGSNPTEADGFSKKIKLVMTPLIGIVSSNCDASVHVSCLNTWSYLLCKLDKLASSPSVVKTVWEPILEVIIKPSVNNQDIDVLLLFGEAMICAVEQASLIAESEVKECESWRSSNIKSSLEFASCFVKLSRVKDETIVSTSVIEKRLLSSLVHFVGCLYLQKDITLFIEIMTSTLLLWLSHFEAQDSNFKDQLQQLWIRTLTCLQKMRPIVEFDSSFLLLQELLLEKTLDHPDPLICNSTVNFWNSTFGEQTKLDYPQSLLPVLDKLSRRGKIKLGKNSLLANTKDRSDVNKVTVPNRYKVPTTLRRCSKRVELVGNAANSSEGNDRIYSKSKRRQTELTEHQKEVRRAQQGRSMDCSGHGPGIRTYTSVDFSQVNEESQESQDIRDAETILKMLRKVE